MGWDPNIWRVDILFQSTQLSHFKLHPLHGNSPILALIVYGLNSVVECRQLWDDLKSLSSSNTWCILGDFNTIKWVAKSEGGDSSWDAGMTNFNDCLHSIGLDDIHAIGPQYTWWNCHVKNPIYKKLDKALGNYSWFNSMFDSKTTFGPRGLSDQCPVILNTGLHLQKPKKPFQFFNFML